MFYLSKKPYRQTLNDGFLSYGVKQTQRGTNAKRIGEVFVEQGKLAYQLLTSRESDYQFAHGMGASLDLKVKTLHPPFFHAMEKSKLKVVIHSKEYDVIRADVDVTKTYIYFFLQEAGAKNE